MANINVSNGFKWVVSLILSLPLAVFTAILLNAPLNVEGSPGGIIFAIPFILVFAIIWFSVISLLLKHLLQTQTIDISENAKSPRSLGIMDLPIILVSAIASFFIGSIVLIKLLDFDNSNPKLFSGSLSIAVFIIPLIISYMLPFLLIRKILSKIVHSIFPEKV